MTVKGLFSLLGFLGVLAFQILVPREDHRLLRPAPGRAFAGQLDHSFEGETRAFADFR